MTFTQYLQLTHGDIKRVEWLKQHSPQSQGEINKLRVANMLLQAHKIGIEIADWEDAERFINTWCGPHSEMLTYAESLWLNYQEFTGKGAAPSDKLKRYTVKYSGEYTTSACNEQEAMMKFSSLWFTDHVTVFTPKVTVTVVDRKPKRSKDPSC